MVYSTVQYSTVQWSKVGNSPSSHFTSFPYHTHERLREEREADEVEGGRIGFFKPYSAVKYRDYSDQIK